MIRTRGTAIQTVDKQKQRTWAAWALLAACLLLTAASAFYVKKDVEAVARKEFDFGCGEISDKISERLRSHARILRGGAAFFEGSDEITRIEWKKFIGAQGIAVNLPGIPGIGYAIIIPRDALPRHERDIRSEGFPDYIVFPAGDRGFLAPVVYIEPFTGGNVRAFGFDMFSDPVRRMAMEHAQDNDLASLSHKTALVQDTGSVKAAAVFMYVPVYDKALRHETAAERRAAIRGWVFCPYHMNDLMKEFLQRWETNESNQIRIEIFDDPSGTAASLLYDTRSASANAPGADPVLTSKTVIDFNGHQWFVRFTQDNSRSSSIDYAKVWYILVGGTSVSLLLFIIILTLIHTNVTAESRAVSLTAELRESENFLNTIINENPLSIWISDSTGTLLRVNKSYTAMLRMSEADLVGKYNIFRDNIIEEQGLLPLIHRVYDNGETVHFHISYNSARLASIPGGRPEDLILDVTIFPIIDASGAVTHAVIQHRDITDFKNSEQILRDVQRRESIGVLSSGIAHDFNNLLGAMMGNVSIAQTRLSAGHPAAANLDKALKAMERAAHLTEQMLAYAGKGKTQDCLIDVGAMIQEHINLFEVSVSKNVRLETRLPADPVFVKGDPAQFEQVVMNLITNGSEALEEQQGVVSVTVSAASMSDADLAPYGMLTGAQMKTGTYAMITVSDNGVGMSAEMQKKIFDPFYTTKFLGRGLGLSAVLGIIRGHDGGIAIESAAGRGTTFRVILPAHAAPVQTADPQRTEAPQREIVKTTVLVIDDDAEIAAAAGEILATAQYEALIELNPLRGVEVYARRRSEIGVVLLDLTMPEMTGKQAAEALRAIDPNVKIIISSGYSEDEGIKRMGGARYSGFIQKPYTLQSLLSVVHRVAAS